MALAASKVTVDGPLLPSISLQAASLQINGAGPCHTAAEDDLASVEASCAGLHGALSSANLQQVAAQQSLSAQTRCTRLSIRTCQNHRSATQQSVKLQLD
jgi:hypothetical protein